MPTPPSTVLVLLVFAEIGPAFFSTFVIGDFSEEDARQFLDKQLQQDGQPEVQHDDWSEVYKVGA
jgi:hypothetical protein